MIEIKLNKNCAKLVKCNLVYLVEQMAEKCSHLQMVVFAIAKVLENN
jgi:hypothetical protein